MVQIPVKVTVDGKETLVQVAANFDDVAKKADNAKAHVGGFGASVTEALSKVGEGMAQGFGIGMFEKLGEGIREAVVGIPELFASMSEHLIEVTAHLADLRAKTGMSAQGLQELGYAGKMAGVDMESISGSVTKMQKSLIEGSTAFGQLGLSVTQLRQMAPEDAFRKIGSAIAGLKTPAEQAAAAIEIFGKSGASMLPLFKTNMSELAEEAKRLGIIIGDDTVSAGKRLDDALTSMESAWEGFQNQLVSTLISSPEALEGIKAIAEEIGSLTKEVVDHKDDIAHFADGLAEGLRLAIGYAKDLTTEIGEWGKMLGADAIGGAIADHFKGGSDAFAALERTRMKMRQFQTGLYSPDFGGGDIVVKPEAPDFHGKGDLAAEAKAAKELEEAYKHLATGAKSYFDELAKSRAAREDFSLLGPAAEDVATSLEKLVEQAEKFGTAGKEWTESGTLKYISDLEAKIKDLDTTSLEGQDAMKALGDALMRLSAQKGPLSTNGGAETTEGGVAMLEHAQALESQKGLMASITAEQEKQNALWKAAGGEVGAIGTALEAVVNIASSLQNLPSAFAAATNSASGLSRAIGGFKVGADIGAQIGGLAGPMGAAWGKVIGGVIGMTAGFFHKPAWQQVGEEAGKMLGEGVAKGMSQELEQAIADEAKKLGISLHDAILLNLGKIADETNSAMAPMTDSVLELMAKVGDGTLPLKEGIDSITDAFSHMTDEAASGSADAVSGLEQMNTQLLGMISKGLIPAAKGAEILASEFDKLKQAAEEAGGMASAALIQLVQAAETGGVQIAGMMDYLKQQVSDAVAGIQKYIDNIDFDIKGSVQVDTPVAGTDLVGSSVITIAQRNANDAAAAFNAVFWADVATVGLYAASTALGPAFQELKKKIRAAGLDVPEDLLGLNKVFKVFKDPDVKAAMDALDGISAAVKGLANAGIMTTGSFNALADATENAFGKLEAKGLSANQIVQAIGPQIAQLVQYAQEFNIPLPPWLDKFLKANPQIKIPVDPMQQMLTVLKQIADTLDRIAGPHTVGLTPPPGGWPDPTDPDQNPKPPPGTVPPVHGGPGNAGGGTVSGPRSGYWNLLHDTEGIVPKNLFGTPIMFPAGGGFAQRVSTGGGSISSTHLNIGAGAITILQQPGESADDLASRIAPSLVQHVRNNGPFKAAIQSVR
jgi:hypothetical protein